VTVAQRRALAARMPRDPEAALEPYDPRRGHGPWNEALAAHFLRRALGGPRPGQLAEALRQSPQQLVDSVFQPRNLAAEESWDRLGDSLAASGERERLSAWWIQKLIQQERAPGARLSVFWHDHFACTWSKVRDGGQMLAQHRSLVNLGEGRFAELLAALARDPAMLRFLDNDVNRRGAPNENFAREIMELFSLGLGAYDEVDVQQAARALTGRTLRHGRYHFEPMHHDRAPKQVLGAEIGDGDELVEQIVRQDACARFLVTKLWRFYVSPEPPPDVIDLLASRWREQELDVSWLIQRMLRSRAFYSAEAIGRLVRSPVDLVVGTARAWGGKPDLRSLEAAATAMGQALFEPPGVQGWESGQAWIHTSAWIERMRFADQVSHGRSDWHRSVDLGQRFPARATGELRACLRELQACFLPGALEPERFEALHDALASTESDESFATSMYALLCLPEYHLS
jgi:uncharacterized protein (DUF1800 family)